MGHTLRGAVTAWLSLIALQAIVTNGSGKVAAALTDVDRLISRALDPTVPAIPDRRTGGAAAPVVNLTPTGPGQQAFATAGGAGRVGMN
jgi:hypothetical protein